MEKDLFSHIKYAMLVSSGNYIYINLWG